MSKYMSHIGLMLAGCMLLLSCSSASVTREGEGDVSAPEHKDAGVAADSRELKLPEVPPTLTDPQARAGYVLEHFWDSMDFADTSLSLDTAYMEQNFVNFVSLFPHAESSAIPRAVSAMLSRASVDVPACSFVMQIAEKYLYDPNSPLHAEEAYIQFASVATASGSPLGEAERARPAYLLECALKNRPGHKAADFRYTALDGTRQSLRSFCKGSELTLLVFYDPDCETCKSTIVQLSSSYPLNEVIASGRMRVLSVYPDGDASLWRATASQMPSSWSLGIDDGTIEEEQLYILPAMPTLYLLDSASTVILKDPRPDMIIQML